MDEKKLNLQQLKWYDEERAKYSYFPWCYLSEITQKMGLLDNMMSILRDVWSHFEQDIKDGKQEVNQDDINCVDWVISRIDSGVSERFRSEVVLKLNDVYLYKHNIEHALKCLKWAYSILKKQVDRWSISLMACVDEMRERVGLNEEEQ